MSVQIITGDALKELRKLPAESVHCCVTSPPYYGLRDYGTATWEGGDPTCEHRQGRPGRRRADGIVDDREQWARNRDGTGSVGGDCGHCGARRIDAQLGLEATPDAYVAAMVGVFREVRRVLRSDGTLWLNIGDSYASGGRATYRSGASDNKGQLVQNDMPRPTDAPGIKPKDLLGIPWLLAFALRADGWWLRQDIIWSKPNPMPESVTDRCTKAHEYLFLLSKSERYYFDAAAIREASVTPEGRVVAAHAAAARDDASSVNDRRTTIHLGSEYAVTNSRNKWSVWTVGSQPFAEAHFATFPPALVEPCVKAGCPAGGTVLDPFLGAGTTALVADRLGRNAIGIELNPAYAEMAKRRIEHDAGLFAAVATVREAAEA